MEYRRHDGDNELFRQLRHIRSDESTLPSHPPRHAQEFLLPVFDHRNDFRSSGDDTLAANRCDGGHPAVS